MLILSKIRYAKALVEILEKAKAHRDLSDGNEQKRWEEIVHVAYDGLGEPSLADIEWIRSWKER